MGLFLLSHSHQFQYLYTHMNFDFNDCYWHDSILQNIFIDRSNTSMPDTIVMTIDWYDEPPSKIVFNDVYLLKATMNFGMSVKEWILSAAICPPDDPDIVEYYKKCKLEFGSKNINAYIIETNTTGGTIKILAGSVEKVPL